MSPIPVDGGGADRLHVVLFSGGRGAGALARQLAANTRVALTIAVNGYDDGASTGEVRRFLGDALGPSDFRKNASRVAATLGTCPAPLVDLLDSRLPPDATPQVLDELLERCETLAPPAAARLREFARELKQSGRPFQLGGCSVGNLVFAGAYLGCGRLFNAAVDDYCGVLGLPAGVVDNVTDGTNAWLVALDSESRLLETEEAIVSAAHARRIGEIFLLGRPLDAQAVARCRANPANAAAVLASLSVVPPLNPRLAEAIRRADLVIYAAGTQHSSLFPSYLTRGLGAAIASNLHAIKLLLTNIQPDAEIYGSTAVEIIDGAVYYLKEKNRLTTPTPCLVTHYLINDPGEHEPDRPYLPLGPLDTIEDPRLVRIANYEDGVSGRHDAVRVLSPFLDALGQSRTTLRAALLLQDPGTQNKLVQTLLEIVRGGIERVPLALTVCYAGLGALDTSFVAALPFAVQCLEEGESQFARVLRTGGFDYAVFFEASGMYRGEDLVAVGAYLSRGRLDAVWGSRRLSVRDIEASYQLRYRRSRLAGFASYLGSHVLSLAYLLLFGRYISDTLSGIRAVRAADAAAADVDIAGRQLNHHLLTNLLGRKADILEVPAQFLPLSPERVRRTSIADGLRALGTIVRRRFARHRR